MSIYEIWAWGIKPENLTAVSTLVIAAFTVILALTSAFQALLTRKSIKVANSNFRAAERAFVFLDGFACELTVAADQKKIPELPERFKDHPELYITRFAIQPRWKNSGNTPTRRMRIQVNWQGPEQVPPLEYDYRKEAKPFFVGPKNTEPSEVIEITTAAAIVNWAMSPLGLEPLILIWGRADYEDIFDGRHFVEWCYRLRFSRPSTERMIANFIQWDEHNRSDKDERM